MNEQRRVLYVDDDGEFSEAMAARCRSMGVAVMTAKNALTAVTIAETWRPDVVCFDVEMPTGNGLDVCEFLASNPGLSHATFVIITGRSDREIVRRCGELRAHYIAKSPATWRQLQDVLCRALPDLQRSSIPTPSAN